MQASDHAFHFLEAVLYCDEEYSGREVHEFSPAFFRAVTDFIQGFLNYLEQKNPELKPELLGSGFGHNMFFSLSGHGCGFWDTEETEPFMDALHEYAGTRLRFEAMDLDRAEYGQLDLAIAPEQIEEYRRKMFGV